MREETITTACTHLDRIQITESDATACPLCEETSDDWVQLRMCLVCGNVGCCDDSANKHATSHSAETGHPLLRSLERGDDWWYCYVDRNLVREPAGAPRPGPDD